MLSQKIICQLFILNFFLQRFTFLKNILNSHFHIYIMIFTCRAFIIKLVFFAALFALQKIGPDISFQFFIRRKCLVIIIRCIGSIIGIIVIIILCRFFFIKIVIIFNLVNQISKVVLLKCNVDFILIFLILGDIYFIFWNRILKLCVKLF